MRAALRRSEAHREAERAAAEAAAAEAAAQAEVCCVHTAHPRPCLSTLDKISDL